MLHTYCYRIKELCIKLVIEISLYGYFEHAFLGTFAKFQKVTVSFVMSVCLPIFPSAWNNSVSTGQIFMKFYI